MTRYLKDRTYTLAHTDPGSGYGLLYSKVNDDCVFLNPFAVALWRAPIDVVDSERDGELFERVFKIPEGKSYLTDIITQLAERGLLLPNGPVVAPIPGLTTAKPPGQVSQPPLEQVYFYATRECNARCYHCYQPTLTVDGGPRETTVDQINCSTFLAFLNEALPLGVRGVKITGGEPLLRADFRELASGAQALGLGVSVETNGYFLDEAMADFLAGNGVSVSVSLDGGSAEVHDRLRCLPGSFNRATRAVRMIVERGGNPTIIMAISQRNLGELEPVLAAAAACGCRRVKFNPVNSLGIARHLDRDNVLLDLDEILSLYSRRVELEERYNVFLFLEGPPSFFSIHELVTGHSAVCPFTRIIGILADGSISFCGVGNSCPELVFGRIGDDLDIRSFWYTAQPLLEARRIVAGRLDGVCSLCVLAPYCRGSCRALAYCTSGSLKGPHHYCQTLYERGRFPAHYLQGGE